jgi:hypothetical protein
MLLTDEKKHEIDLYGKVMDGEDNLTRAKLARRKYLKEKMRPKLAAIIGDYGDNITDATRAIVLGQAIQLGLVTDKAAIAAYKEYINGMLKGYGGATAIISVLAKTSAGLQSELVDGYYKAAADIEAAEDEDYVRRVDLPGEPVTEDEI